MNALPVRLKPPNRFLQAALPRFGLLRFGDPAEVIAPICGGERGEISPRQRMGAESAANETRHRSARRKPSRRRGDVGGKLCAAGVGHPTFFDETSEPLAVELRPLPCARPGREPLHVMSGVQPVDEPIDPAEAQRLLDSFRVTHARLSRVLLCVDEPDLRLARVVALEPGPPLVAAGRVKSFSLHFSRFGGSGVAVGIGATHVRRFELSISAVICHRPSLP